ncbi:MAG: hypothetical protein H0X53_04375 [Sphingomonas sp.]|nr:hypothetical protein [Sphingomonas sp.]
MDDVITPARLRAFRRFWPLRTSHRFALLSLGASLLVAGCGVDDPALPLGSVQHNYQYGEVISFRAGGDSTRFRTSGWAAPDSSGTWTDAPAASLTVRVRAPEHHLLLSMTLLGHTHTHLPQQPVELYVNREKVATWSVANLGGYTAVIPKQLAERGLLIVDLHVVKATSPAELGTSSDSRRLGVLCSELVMSETESTGTRAYNIGTLVRFGQAAGSEAYRVQGWSVSEPDGTWTDGNTAVLELQTPRTRQPLLLRARVTPMRQLPDVPSQPTDVYANGELVAQWDVSDGPADYRAKLPAEIIARSETLRLEFRIPRAISPKAAGASEDARQLGLWWSEMQIVEDR